MSFEWHTEEEEEQRAPDPSRPPNHSFHRWRWPLLLLLFVLVAAGFMGWRRARRYVAEVEAQETTSLLASERLAQRAAPNRDRELLKTVLSGRDPRWLQEQYHLLDGGLFLQEAGRALALTPAAVVPLSLSFNAALSEGEAVIAHTYMAVEDEEVTTVTLAQTRLYRRGRERWLLAPPADDFWGARQIVRRPHFTLTYPARDREIALRLAGDLERVLAELCAFPEVGCSPALQLRIALVRSPESLLEMVEETTFWHRGGDVDLPAPSLIGHPQDEASYRALLRGYAIPVVEAAVTELVAYECCDQALLYRATLDWQLDRPGHRILAPPLSAFSPDGRWLVAHTSMSLVGERGEFFLLDLETGERLVEALAPWWVQSSFRPGQQFAWSADGGWLARVATHQIDLIAPRMDGVYRRYVQPPANVPGGANCEAVGWTDAD